MVIRLSTTSKMGVWNSPGGRPTRLMVPFRRTIFSACANAGGETAVTSTPCAPPPVCLDNLLRGIRRLGIDRHFGARRTSQRKLVLGDVEGGDMQAHRLGVLHGELPEAADPGDCEPLSRASLRSP